MQNLMQKMKQIGNSFSHLRKNVDDFWLNFLDLSGAEVCKSCRSRQELSNECLLAKIGLESGHVHLSCARIPVSLFFSGKDRTNLLACFACVDTAENEPLKVWRKIQFIIHSPP